MVTYTEAQYKRLMEIGRQLVQYEALFGKGSAQYKSAKAKWRRQQDAMGVQRGGPVE